MRRKIIQFIIIFVGICLIAYPWISNYVYEHAAQSTVNTYSEKVKEVNAPYIEGQFTASVDTEKSYSLDEIGDMSFEPGTGRGAEVDKYIKDNNIKQFVIFDDEDWDWTYYGLEEHWCRSTYYDKKYGGLQPGHIKMTGTRLNIKKLLKE